VEVIDRQSHQSVECLPTAGKLAATKPTKSQATFIRRLRTRREATYKCALLCLLCFLLLATGGVQVGMRGLWGD
jgi:hypothetical protein